MERFKLISAVHVFLIRDSQVLLLRRFHTGYEDGNYSVPAGHIDGGESVKSAAIREVEEECSIRIASENLQGVGVMHRHSRDERIDFFLMTSRWEGAISNAEPDKCDDLSWFPLWQLPDNVIPYVKYALANYQQGNWFMEYGWEQSK